MALGLQRGQGDVQSVESVPEQHLPSTLNALLAMLDSSVSFLLEKGKVLQLVLTVQHAYVVGYSGTQ
jgi:hypothetical protein